MPSSFTVKTYIKKKFFLTKIKKDRDFVKQIKKTI